MTRTLRAYDDRDYPMEEEKKSLNRRAVFIGRTDVHC